MPRRMLGALLIPILLAAPVQAQYVGAGSTIQGDYLRGVGIAAQGMGQYNLQTAQANAINTQTWMTWNEYIWNVAKNENKEAVQHRDAMLAKHRAAYNDIQKRLKENPESLDVTKGDALNVLLEDLNNPRISESSFRYAEVPLPVDVVRRIPFKLAEVNGKFSMSRLSIKNKGKLPVAFQDDRFAPELRIYNRALDTALEQAMNGKLQQSALNDVEKAVEGLWQRLNTAIGLSTKPSYIEAKIRLEELDKTARLLAKHKVELALGDIDKYSGTTVNDLRIFMHKHNLQFAPADNPDERSLYPELYAALVQQRDKLAGAIPPDGK
jgi:hypothetical protein